MEQPSIQIGQFVLGKNLGIGAFGKVRFTTSKRHQDEEHAARSLTPVLQNCIPKFVDVTSKSLVTTSMMGKRHEMTMAVLCAHQW